MGNTSSTREPKPQGDKQDSKSKGRKLTKPGERKEKTGTKADANFAKREKRAKSGKAEKTRAKQQKKLSKATRCEIDGNAVTWKQWKRFERNLTDKRDDDPSGGYFGSDGVRTYFVRIEDDGTFFRATQK